MNDLEIAESRVVHESPVHGPALVEELNRLRARETELLKSWAADDHEARMMHFALHDIEVAAKAEGRPALAHLAQEVRLGNAGRTERVKRLLDALGALAIPEGNFDWMPAGPEREELNEAYAPFRGSR